MVPASRTLLEESGRRRGLPRTLPFRKEPPGPERRTGWPARGTHGETHFCKYLSNSIKALRKMNCTKGDHRMSGRALNPWAPGASFRQGGALTLRREKTYAGALSKTAAEPRLEPSSPPCITRFHIALRYLLYDTQTLHSAQTRDSVSREGTFQSPQHLIESQAAVPLKLCPSLVGSSTDTSRARTMGQCRRSLG